MTRAAFTCVPGLLLAPLDTASTSTEYLVTTPAGRRWQVSETTARVLLVIQAGDPLESLVDGWPVHERRAALSAISSHAHEVLVPAGLIERYGADPSVVGALNDIRTAGDRGESRLGGDVTPGDEAGVPRRARALLWRKELLSARSVAWMSAPLLPLGSPWFVWPAFLLAVASSLAVLARGSHASTASALFAPGATLIALGSAWAHELGHATACRARGCRHGELGFGLYGLFPVLFMQLDDTWRLSRADRAAVAAAGVAFQWAFSVCALSVAAPFAPALARGSAWIVAAMIVSSLNPLLKFDGYWLLSDALGVPNLRTRAAAAARRAVSRLARARRTAPEPAAPVYSEGTTALLVLYGVVCFLYFGWLGVRLARSLPRFVTRTYPALVSAKSRAAATAAARGDVLVVLGHASSLLLPTALLAGALLLVCSVWWRLARLIARTRSHGRRRTRTASSGAVTAIEPSAWNA